MITITDLMADGPYDWELSLTKLTGAKVRDIRGYLTNEFGEPAFKLTRIVFEDGTELDCEGEHDLPYVVTHRNREPQNMDDATLARLYQEANP